jgi:hypothetical protein
MKNRRNISTKCLIISKSYSFGKYSFTDSLSAYDNKIERKGPNNSHHMWIPSSDIRGEWGLDP